MENIKGIVITLRHDELFCNVKKTFYLFFEHDNIEKTKGVITEIKKQIKNGMKGSKNEVCITICGMQKHTYNHLSYSQYVFYAYRGYHIKYYTPISNGQIFELNEEIQYQDEKSGLKFLSDALNNIYRTQYIET